MKELFNFDESNATKKAYISAYNVFVKWVEKEKKDTMKPTTMVEYLTELSSGYPRFSQTRDASYVRRRFNRVMTVALANKSKIKIDEKAVNTYFDSVAGTPVSGKTLAEKKTSTKKPKTTPVEVKAVEGTETTKVAKTKGVKSVKAAAKKSKSVTTKAVAKTKTAKKK
jgi:hypothetical protein